MEIIEYYCLNIFWVADKTTETLVHSTSLYIISKDIDITTKDTGKILYYSNLLDIAVQK